MKLPDIDKPFEEYLINLGLDTSNTISKYLSIFNQFRALYSGHLTQPAVDSFLGLKNGNPYRATISHLLHFLRRQDYLSPEETLEVSRINILRQTGRKETQPTIYFTEEEINRLCERCTLNEFQRDRFRIMVKIQYESGMRISELCGLYFRDLYGFEGKTKFYEDGKDKFNYQKILVPGSSAKGGQGNFVYVSTKTFLEFVDFLLKYFNEKRDWVLSIKNNHKKLFGLNKTAYSVMVKEQVFQTLGIRLPKGQCTHSLRHSRNMKMVNEKKSMPIIQKFMRHKSIASTQRYIHLTNLDLENELEKKSNED